MLKNFIKIDSDPPELTVIELWSQYCKLFTSIEITIFLGKTQKDSEFGQHQPFSNRLNNNRYGERPLLRLTKFFYTSRYIRVLQLGTEQINFFFHSNWRWSRYTSKLVRQFRIGWWKLLKLRQIHSFNNAELYTPCWYQSNHHFYCINELIFFKRMK